MFVENFLGSHLTKGPRPTLSTPNAATHLKGVRRTTTALLRLTAGEDSLWKILRNDSLDQNDSYNESVRSSDNSGLNGQKPPLRPGELKSQAGNLAAQPLHCEQPLKQTDVRSAEPKLQPKSRELEPQEPCYQEPQSQESPLQATSRLQESPSQESPPQATHLQESSSQEFPPQESPPQESPPQKSSPQAPRCQESAPQESAPQESAPQESFIQESHLKQPDIQPAVSKLQSESKGSQASESHPIDQFVSSLL